MKETSRAIDRTSLLGATSADESIEAHCRSSNARSESQDRPVSVL